MFFRKKKKDAGQGPAGAATASGSAGAEETGPTVGADADGPPGKKSGPATQFLTGEAEKDRHTVQILLDTIARVSRSRDLESLLTFVVDSSIKLTAAERGLLILRGSGETPLVVRTGRLRGKKGLADDVRFSTSIANKVLEEAQPVRATVHSESEALELGKSVFDLKLRAVMCVPLNGSDEEDAEPRGVLYVDSRAATRQFSQGDLALFAALAQQISIAMENARLHIDSLEKIRMEASLELATAIQSDLMPGVPSNLEGWDVHGWYRPADEAAGDFYDFVKVKDGRLAIVVGDATGHGIGPALITATTQGSLRTLLKHVAEPAEVITELNEDLSSRVEDGRFLTLYLAMLGVDGSLAGLNAGHALPFLWRRATNEVELLTGGGPALGMIEDFVYESSASRELADGDVLVVYTDGLSEARAMSDPDTLFGESGIEKALCEAAQAGKDAKGILTAIIEEAMALSHDAREDDITIVVARHISPSA